MVSTWRGYLHVMIGCDLNAEGMINMIIHGMRWFMEKLCFANQSCYYKHKDDTTARMALFITVVHYLK